MPYDGSRIFKDLTVLGAAGTLTRPLMSTMWYVKCTLFTLSEICVVYVMSSMCYGITTASAICMSCILSIVTPFQQCHNVATDMSCIFSIITLFLQCHIVARYIYIYICHVYYL